MNSVKNRRMDQRYKVGRNHRMSEGSKAPLHALGSPEKEKINSDVVSGPYQ